MKLTCGDSQGSSALLSDETVETPQEMNERNLVEQIHLRRICHADVGAHGFPQLLRRLGARPQESEAGWRNVVKLSIQAELLREGEKDEWFKH